MGILCFYNAIYVNEKIIDQFHLLLRRNPGKHGNETWLWADDVHNIQLGPSDCSLVAAKMVSQQQS